MRKLISVMVGAMLLFLSCAHSQISGSDNADQWRKAQQRYAWGQRGTCR
jgi:hypothetical protein